MSVDGGTTYHPIALHNTSRLTTQYPVGTYISVIYQSTGTVSTYALGGANSASTVTGVFRVLNYYDANTTYSAMSVAEMKAGTATSSRSIRADYLKSAFTASDGIFQTGTESGSINVYGVDIPVKDCGIFEINVTTGSSSEMTTFYEDSFVLYRGQNTSNGLTSDKTFSEIVAAIDDGKTPVVLCNVPFTTQYYHLTTVTSSSLRFSSDCVYALSSGTIYYYFCHILINSNGTNILYYCREDRTAIYAALTAASPSEITVSTSGDVTQEIQPNTIYHFTSDALTSLTITLPSGKESGQYHFDFICPSTAITLILPSSVIMPDNFLINTDTKYEIDIVNSLGVFAQWSYGGAS